MAQNSETKTVGSDGVAVGGGRTRPVGKHIQIIIKWEKWEKERMKEGKGKTRKEGATWSGPSQEICALKCCDDAHDLCQGPT